jgi:hypothetical protein
VEVLLNFRLYHLCGLLRIGLVGLFHSVSSKPNQWREPGDAVSVLVQESIQGSLVSVFSGQSHFGIQSGDHAGQI